jgi:hypothetical protein
MRGKRGQKRKAGRFKDRQEHVIRMRGGEKGFQKEVDSYRISGIIEI